MVKQMKNNQTEKNSKGLFSDSIYKFPLAYFIIFVLIFLVYSQTLFFSLGKLDETNIILDHLSFLSDFHNLKAALLTNPFF